MPGGPRWQQLSHLMAVVEDGQQPKQSRAAFVAEQSQVWEILGHVEAVQERV